MTVLAFYKARGTIIDKAIRVITRSPYSHVEILIGCDVAPDAPFSWPAFSASGRDGGVRTKLITFDDGAWDFIAAPWAPAGRIRLAAETQCGLGYDWAGLIFSQVFNFRRGSPRRWFCSELVAWSLGLPIPSALSPGDLAGWAKFLSNQHLQKERDHDQPDLRADDQPHRD